MTLVVRAVSAGAVLLLIAASAEACSDGVLDLFPPSSANGSDGGAGSSASADASGSNDAERSSDAAGQQDGPAGSCAQCGSLSACVDLANDPTHCGSCTRVCAHYQLCRAGNCVCLKGFTLCGDGSCHDLMSEPDHCGSCTHPPCASGERCENGVCTPGTASCTTPGATACPALGNRTACVVLARGAPYCGSCGNVCGPDQVCAGNTCRSYSPATPCNTCPCSTECATKQGQGASCCAGLEGSAQPICVHGTACPP